MAETFGDYIKQYRVFWELSQKEVAALIKKEDGTPISPQYWNDIELNRRDAPPDALLSQIANELCIPPDSLFYLAGKIPPDLRGKRPDQVREALREFRSKVKELPDA